MSRVLAGALAIVLTSVAGAQTSVSDANYTVHPAVGNSNAVYAAAYGDMRADLRNLIMAQEMYWRANNHYASSTSDLSAYTTRGTDHIEIARAGADGWTAKASAAAAPGRSCVIWAGPVPTADRPATDDEHKTFPEAEVSCDGDGYTQQSEWASAAQSYMTYALHNLARVQEKYRALNGTYAGDPATLDPFIWDRGVSVTILTATSTAWSARAVFGSATGRSCVIYRGDMAQTEIPHTALKDKPGVRDEVVCDGL